MLKRLLAFAATLAMLVIPLSLRAEDHPGHRVIAQDKGNVTIFAKDGSVEWQYECKHNAHDVQVLASGNILLNSGGATVSEITPEKKVVWSYTAKPIEGKTDRVEVHACQRLENGNTMVAESGNRRIVEVDAEGKIVAEVPLTVDKPNAHRDTRLARKLASGNYLVAHENDGCVREYDPSGKVVWKYALDLGGRPAAPGHGPEGHGNELFGMLRLENGNTLIATGNGNRVIEVTPEGKQVFSIEQEDLPGIKLAWVTTLDVLKNGNIVIGNCHAGEGQPQLVEVTREKKVVWKFYNWKELGNSTATAHVIE